MSGNRDLTSRARLLRSLVTLGEMLPGSFVERKRACGRPNCRCADGKNLHVQYQLSTLVNGKPKVFHIPARMLEQVRQQVAMRHRFDSAAATICNINLSRFLEQKEEDS
jgi:hypothetical protein